MRIRFIVCEKCLLFCNTHLIKRVGMVLKGLKSSVTYSWRQNNPGREWLCGQLNIQRCSVFFPNVVLTCFLGAK